MSKIVQAVNSMIENESRIKPVIQGGSEYFFCYNGKYFWGMRPRQDANRRSLHLYYYPDAKSVEDLAAIEDDDWDDVRMVSYSDIGERTVEARQSFRDLFELLRQKASGLDNVLDDIISDQ